MNAKQSLKKVLVPLRRSGDEAQLTQIIASFATDDPPFAAAVAKALVSASGRKQAAAFLNLIPDELDCEAEHHAFDDHSIDRGFVDLRFFDEDRGFNLFVELKLHSGYGDQQLDRYLDALRGLPAAGDSALLAVTTHIPAYGEQGVEQSDQWLGSARWAHAYAGLICAAPRDPERALIWAGLLKLIREQGDFGVMDVDREAIEGWARWKQGRTTLVSLLEEIHEPALDTVRSILSASSPSDQGVVAAYIRHNEKRLVWPWGESLNMQIAIPAVSKVERLRIQFASAPSGLIFTTEARHEDNRVLTGASTQLLEATQRLRAKSFSTGHYWGAYWARPHSPEEWMSGGGTVSDRLLKHVRKDTQDIADSGLFEAMPRSTSVPNHPDLEVTDPAEALK